MVSSISKWSPCFRLQLCNTIVYDQYSPGTKKDEVRNIENEKYKFAQAVFMIANINATLKRHFNVADANGGDLAIALHVRLLNMLMLSLVINRADDIDQNCRNDKANNKLRSWRWWSFWLLWFAQRRWQPWRHTVQPTTVIILKWFHVTNLFWRRRLCSRASGGTDLSILTWTLFAGRKCLRNQVSIPRDTRLQSRLRQNKLNAWTQFS